MDAKKQYDRLLTDLLGVLDAVDQACAHWQTVEAEMEETATAIPADAPAPPAASPMASPAASPAPELNPLQQVARAAIAGLESLFGLERAIAVPASAGIAATESPSAPARESAAELAEIIASGREGAELIQRSLLDALRQQNITPIPALGQPFDSKTMFAIDRQTDPSLPENTILEELVRGYQQSDRILREAQVIVSSKT